MIDTIETSSFDPFTPQSVSSVHLKLAQNTQQREVEKRLMEIAHLPTQKKWRVRRVLA